MTAVRRRRAPNRNSFYSVNLQYFSFCVIIKSAEKQILKKNLVLLLQSSCFLASQGAHEVTTMFWLSVVVDVANHGGRNSVASGFN